MNGQPKKGQGFTIIEMLIVIAIVAILAAIAVPNFLEAEARSKMSRIIAKAKKSEVLSQKEVEFLSSSSASGLIKTEKEVLAEITNQSLERPPANNIEVYFISPVTQQMTQGVFRAVDYQDDVTSRILIIKKGWTRDGILADGLEISPYIYIRPGSTRSDQ